MVNKQDKHSEYVRPGTLVIRVSCGHCGRSFYVAERKTLLPRNLAVGHVVDWPCAKVLDGLEEYVSYSPVIASILHKLFVRNPGAAVNYMVAVTGILLRSGASEEILAKIATGLVDSGFALDLLGHDSIYDAWQAHMEAGNSEDDDNDNGLSFDSPGFNPLVPNN